MGFPDRFLQSFLPSRFFFCAAQQGRETLIDLLVLPK